MRSLIHRALATALVLTGLPLRAQAPAATAGRPTLVVLIAVDQMRADYYSRFSSHLHGGRRRLVENGAVFTNAFQDHAFTETAPGHASMLSGRFPVHHGIATNAQGVNTPTESVLGGGPGDQGASPFRFLGTTLVDWMRAGDPSTRFLSVSRKDRGAILPIGRSKGNVFWFASTGEFTTSSYYGDTVPTWVRQFNARHLPWSYRSAPWTPMYGADVYPEPDSVPVENGGRDFTFNHVMPRDAAAADTAIINFPWMDDLTLQFALDGIAKLGLGGTRGRTDLLSISLSTTDAIGHRYGPDSKELHDHIIQLDRFLGGFLDSLYAMRDSSTVLIALTADHGVTPFPTLRSPNYPNEGAERVDLAPTWALMRDRLARAGIGDTLVTFADNILTFANPAAVRSKGLSADSIAQSFASEVLRVQGVMRADLVSKLPASDTTRDAIARRWLHVFRAESDTVRLVVTLTPNSYNASVTYATHGSPHDADAQVPIVFYGPTIRAGNRPNSVRVVDIAPTLADLLGVRTLETLDGISLRRLIAAP
jgi:predicted AlkP superfamily pyrophosphatase or phosphodiesterase